ncbi:MAG: YidC/Oxa1 family insertase periplasmic-domain containing protein [Phycisphaerae bacterium]
MDKRRLTISLVLFAAGLLFFVFYMNYRTEQELSERHTQTRPAPSQQAETDGDGGADAGDEDAAQAAPDGSADADSVEPSGEAEIASADTGEPPATDGQPQTPPATEPSEPQMQADAETTQSRWLHNVAGEARTYRIGSPDPRTGYTFELELTSMGAAVNTAKLAQYFVTVEDKQLWENSPDEYEVRRREDPDKYQGHYELLTPVTHGGGRNLPYETGELTVDADGLPQVTFDLANLPWRIRQTPTTGQGDSQSVSFVYTLAHGTPSDFERLLRITKTYTVRKNDYTLGLSLEVENLSQRGLEVSLTQAGPTGVPREDYRSDMRQAAVGRWSDENQAVGVQLYDRGRMKDFEAGQNIIKGEGSENGPIVWVGVINKFFGSMMYLRPEEGEGPGAERLNATYSIAPAMESAESKAFTTDVTFPGLSLEPGASRRMAFDVFAGPKKRDMFSDSGAPYYRQQYKDLNYVSTISLRSCFCAWSELSLGMMWLLQKLSVATLGNYGLAIIILVILVRAVLHPLTKKGQVSMHKMQKLAPQMQRLKEKYADDKEALNREMMALYKKAGASPFLGCLPMLLQMPIWIALYSGLNASVELRHAGLLPFWLTDLAAPDTIFSWSPENSLWVVGNRFSLLPILMAIAMALQSKFNPQMSASMSPEQAKQQKMMKYMFPAFFLFIFYQMPSGLNLYIMTSTFVGVAEQYVIRKHLQEKEAEQAARETTVKLPGKPPRSKRPKKPKGPFWTKHG